MSAHKDAPPSQSFALTFPMRGGKYLSQLVLPHDMTKSEADRLCAYVMSLAQPESRKPAMHEGEK